LRLIICDLFLCVKNQVAAHRFKLESFLGQLGATGSRGNDGPQGEEGPQGLAGLPGEMVMYS